MYFLEVSAYIHEDQKIGKIVHIYQSAGSMSFQHSMTPQQARDMATALNNAANQLEIML
jgi:hypothetical protein